MWGLGATSINKKAYILFCNKNNKREGTFTVRESKDGINFSTIESSAKIVNFQGPSDNIDQCTFINISKSGSYYYLTYKIQDKNRLCIARSKNLIDWEKKAALTLDCDNGKILSNYKYGSKYAMFTGGNAIHLYLSDNLKEWKCTKYNLLTIDDHADQIIILDTQVIKEGIFVIYAKLYKGQSQITNYTKTKKNPYRETDQYKIFGALFDKKKPTKLLWKSPQEIYSTKNTPSSYAKLFGAVLFDEYLVSYWTNNKGEMFLIRHFYNYSNDVILEKDASRKKPSQKKPEKTKQAPTPILQRPPVNPIMEPRERHNWESLATYNPTAIVHDDTIHIIYRADGHDLMSVWGYASTVDGINIDNRLSQAIYQRKSKINQVQLPSPTPYTSGSNGNGGCEDPRAVLIDGIIYITFTAFDGWGSVRVALTSIRLDDFLNKNWAWRKTVLISPPGEINKNWVIFPDKINGKFAILHSFYPNILIDYFDSLDELDGKTFIKSNNTRPVDTSREWDSWFRGVGPAPLKTDDGWLVFYHAMDHKNPDRYKLGALLLDLNDPTKILYRSDTPILEPEESYENEGIKWGVVYSCGAVIKDGQVFIYYGGADKFVCVATAPLADIISDLKKTGGVKMMLK